MESALALTAGGLLFARAGSAAGALQLLLADPACRPLAAASAVLAVELAFVFPALNLCGRQLIVDACTTRPGVLSAKQRQYVAELRAAVAAAPSPPRSMHMLAGVLALTKTGLLGMAAWELLRGLGGA